ncbi:LysR family transcriptional regulator [Diaphorobacter ruginosibacter]|uniref:LysR family transcriptional regulator n=1 Tax=Diaphorobacter ruginosibacter TaxID=1715720 RepID=A0A7G9RLU4_9BURK|nr:LysR family transcriptional regulator [Diaphorobacter ruginosibacter]QNN56569.1 LysR family transcriptional regulator [Diaphorobacter ruginosibacter]
MQDFNDMLYFAEILERGSFTAASKALGIPKSRLSRRISELERQLGARLLQRTTRKLSPTEVGEIYLRHCQSMRDEAVAAANAVEQVQAVPCGTVRVTCPPTLARTVLGELIPTYMKRCPQVRLEVRVLNRPVNLVEEGIDIALRVRKSLEDSGSLVIKRLGEGRVRMVASPDLLVRQGTPHEPQDLEYLDSLSIAADNGHATLQLFNEEGTEALVPLKPRYVVDDLLMMKFAAMSGIGFCWLPDFLCHQEIEDGRLVELLPEWTQSAGIVHAVFPSRQGLRPAVRSFLDFLGETIPQRIRL